jgi:DNA-binding MarR family transcriptional regulator
MSAKAARRERGARKPALIDRVAADEVLQAAEVRRIRRRFLAHGDAAVRRVGLTPERYLLLLAVKGAPDRSEARSIGQLCDDLQRAQSSVTELVDRAEAAGLVVRSVTDSDARVVRVRLTSRGEDRLQTGLIAIRAERKQLLEHLDRARRHLSDQPGDMREP